MRSRKREEGDRLPNPAIETKRNPPSALFDPWRKQSHPPDLGRLPGDLGPEGLFSLTSSSLGASDLGVIFFSFSFFFCFFCGSCLLGLFARKHLDEFRMERRGSGAVKELCE